MPDTPVDDASARAIANLARVLLEAGALGYDDVVRAADRLDAEGERLDDEERSRFEMMAHWLRCACLPLDPGPAKPRLGVIKGGKPDGENVLT